ncbi:MAG: TetR family transcriptional regulator [Myxococcota bacterium]
MPTALRDTRDMIRRAAYTSFRDHGYHEASVDTICRLAGASKGSFYYHYASKQECFIDILETWTREVISEVQKQFEEATLVENPFAALQAAFRRENARGRLIVPLWLEFTVLARREPAIREVLSRFYHRARLAIAEMLRPFVGPLIQPDELDGLSSAILGVFIGVLTQDLADPAQFEAGAASDAVLKVMGRMFQRIDPTRWSSDARPDARHKKARSTTLEGERISDQAFEAFVKPCSGPVRQCLAELRELVLAAAPTADERVVRGWRILGYDAGGLFCSLKPQRNHVDLGFHHGDALADPKGVLSGRGKHLRQVRVKAGAAQTAADAKVLGALVREALALQRGRVAES